MRAPLIVILVAATVVTFAACGGGKSDPDPDIAPPVPGSGPVVTVTTSSALVRWTQASDDGSEASALQYLAYYSTSNDIGTLGEVEANGTAVGSYTAGVTSSEVLGLTAGATYYFNVLVRDEAGNRAAYVSTAATLDQGTVFVFNADDGMGGDHGGRAGLDAECAARLAAEFGSLGCTHVSALMSVSADDELRDLPVTAGLPASYRFASARSNLTIATSFADLLDGSIQRSIAASGVLGGGFYWTGTNPDGSLAAAHCAGWTGVGTGVTGDASTTDGTWVNEGQSACGAAITWLCGCW